MTTPHPEQLADAVQSGKALDERHTYDGPELTAAGAGGPDELDPDKVADLIQNGDDR